MALMQKLKRFVALLLLAAMVGGQALPVQAAMVGTAALVQQQQSQLERDELVQLLARDDVQQQLVALGVDVEAATARVAQMTDSEVALLNSRLAELPAGGSDVLTIAFLVFLVFIVTDIIGATDIFPFVHPVK